MKKLIIILLAFLCTGCTLNGNQTKEISSDFNRYSGLDEISNAYLVRNLGYYPYLAQLKPDRINELNAELDKIRFGPIMKNENDEKLILVDKNGKYSVACYKTDEENTILSFNQDSYGHVIEGKINLDEYFDEGEEVRIRKINSQEYRNYLIQAKEFERALANEIIEEKNINHQTGYIRDGVLITNDQEYKLSFEFDIYDSVDIVPFSAINTKMEELHDGYLFTYNGCDIYADLNHQFFVIDEYRSDEIIVEMMTNGNQKLIYEVYESNKDLLEKLIYIEPDFISHLVVEDNQVNKVNAKDLKWLPLDNTDFYGSYEVMLMNDYINRNYYDIVNQNENDDFLHIEVFRDLYLDNLNFLFDKSTGRLLSDYELSEKYYEGKLEERVNDKMDLKVCENKLNSYKDDKCYLPFKLSKKDLLDEIKLTSSSFYINENGKLATNVIVRENGYGESFEVEL